MCSGRVDLAFVLRAFSNGTDGVFIGGCHLNECHYITDGNHHAFAMVQICRKMLAHIGLNPERLRIEQMSAGEGIRFAEVMNDFSKKLRELGPLGRAKESTRTRLKLKLEAITEACPVYQVGGEGKAASALPIRRKSMRHISQSDEMDRLFQELIFEKLAISRNHGALAGRTAVDRGNFRGFGRANA